MVTVLKMFFFGLCFILYDTYFFKNFCGSPQQTFCDGPWATSEFARKSGTETAKIVNE